jgi:hypothetical protein
LQGRRPSKEHLQHGRPQTNAGIPTALEAILESPRIRKCGVGIAGDVSKLALDFDCHVQGVVDIAAEMNRRVLPSGSEVVELTGFSLAEACERLLGHSLPKPPNTRCSNWETFPLTTEQQRYAALDAFASLQCGMRVLSLPPRRSKILHERTGYGEGLEGLSQIDLAQ